jgi:predicted nucleic acid-binding protein
VRLVLDTNTALAAQAEFIVSGDAQLLDLKHFQAIPIVTAREALKRLAIG